MNTCLCGNAVQQEGALCERCSALQILGLNADATEKQIESAYRVLVKVWHPDRFQNDAKLKETAEEKLKTINSAHAYLASNPESKARRKDRKKAAPPPQETAMRPAAQTSRGTLLDTTLVSGLLLRCLIALAALAVPILLLVGLDSWMTSNPGTSGIYLPYRGRVLFTLRTEMNAAREKASGILPRVAMPSQEQSAPGSPAPNTPAQAQDTAISVPVPHVPMPYVTVGLTKDEVATVMGAPASATADALRYPGAIFYLHQGKVAGWKVAPGLIPMRVKLWPGNHPDANLTAFTMGSSRDDVIAVQGTPTLLTENKLAYGASEVFFEGGRVIGWNDSHSSERLRIASH